MKQILLPIALALTLVACDRDDVIPTGESPFGGRCLAGRPIVQMQYDLHEEGVEASIDSLTLFDAWHWNSQRQLTSINHDTEGIYDHDGPLRSETYHYDGQGRLESIVEDYSGRTCYFYYAGGLLSRITYPMGNSGRQHRIEFHYHSGSAYPYAMVFVQQMEDFMADRYGDTVVQTWTLQWRGGNLVQATADSVAQYWTGVSQVDYYYDQHPNSMKGLFFASQITQDGFVDEPTSLCLNNMVRRVRHYTNSSTEDAWNYTYGPDGYPTRVSYSFETMYWTTFYVTNHITYGEFTE